MNIGGAVNLLHLGHKVSRKGWNGKGMFLFLMSEGSTEHPAFTGPSLPYVVMKTAMGEAVPWLCSQTDLLAEDWDQVA